MKKVMLAEIRW